MREVAPYMVPFKGLYRVPLSLIPYEEPASLVVPEDARSRVEGLWS